MSDKYFKHTTNLAAYRRIGDLRDYWESRWQVAPIEQILETGRKGGLGELEYPFVKYLPKDKPILEAGCGKGKYVCALRARGYHVEGIDYAEKTVELLKTADPTLDVSVGDILAIDKPENYYGAYISIGVLEHNFDGPHSGLKEAYRVLRPRGVALITVPYLNWPRRRLWHRVPEVSSPILSDGLRFYQDHIDVPTFTRQLAEAGFTVLELYPHVLFGGLVRDWRLGRWLYGRNFFSWRLSQYIRASCRSAPNWLRRDLSHMMLFVCRK
jgi:SAM-dependent methyltransferase